MATQPEIQPTDAKSIQEEKLYIEHIYPVFILSKKPVTTLIVQIFYFVHIFPLD
jgi:hypothetical protein